ncbi:hypothetical protein BsWGS_12601 [Bradybaena similaris]
MEARLQTTVPASNRGQDNFKHLAEFSGSENEREAHRKNRVIQRRLGVCLSEITLQQRSSALVHRKEEARFLQKAKTRSTQPRSAKMLAQLKSRQPHINTPPSRS